MDRNYLKIKENPYRFGVLQGNYVEEIYARDFMKTYKKEPMVKLSETQAQFQRKTTEKMEGEQDNCERDTENAQNPAGKKAKGEYDFSILNTSKIREELSEVQTKTYENTELGENESEENRNPRMCYQSAKKKKRNEDDLDDYRSANKSIKKLKGKRVVRGQGSNKSNKGEIGDFLTTYNLCFDKHIKPQDFVLNDTRSDVLIKNTTILNMEKPETQEKSQMIIEKEPAKSYHRKSQNFTNTFNNPVNSIGFRS